MMIPNSIVRSNLMDRTASVNLETIALQEYRMSMKGNYLRVSAETLDKVTARPKRLDELLGPTLLATGNTPNHLSLDKAWHAIHYLLNGNGGCGISLLSDAVIGGTPIGDEEFGYGPPRGLTSGEVRKVSAALAKISIEKLLIRYDPA